MNIFQININMCQFCVKWDTALRLSQSNNTRRAKAVTNIVRQYYDMFSLRHVAPCKLCWLIDPPLPDRSRRAIVSTGRRQNLSSRRSFVQSSIYTKRHPTPPINITLTWWRVSSITVFIPSQISRMLTSEVTYQVKKLQVRFLAAARSWTLGP